VFSIIVVYGIVLIYDKYYHQARHLNYYVKIKEP